ncbi:MAG: surface-adhesin E family protein [Thermodesulfobacteriota bacterium]
MRLITKLNLLITVCFFLFLTLQVTGSEDSVWYKVEISSTANPIYVDYKTIKKREEITKYEQLEFLKEKQKVDGTDIEYQFIISKRETDCENKKYYIKEEKYFDSELNFETDEVTEDMVYKLNHKDNGIKNWKNINPDTPLEKVWKFVCMYKDTKN